MQNNIDNDFLKMAFDASKKSDCIKENRQIGAVYVKDNQVIASGANEIPKSICDCETRGKCIRKELGIQSGTQLEICYSNCAEMVALVNANRVGKSIEGSTLYCTHKPCSRCLRTILEAGVDRIVYSEDYPDKFSDELIKESGIKTKKIKI